MTRRRSAARDASTDAEIEDVARITQRLAVLLSAGVSPVRAWEYLEPGGAHTGTSAAVTRAAGEAGRRGESVADAIAGQVRHSIEPGGQLGEAWLALASAWEVATRAGAPLASCLRRLAASLRDLGQLHAELETALAGPAATARMVAVLPVVGIGFGALLGFDTLRTLFLTVPGWLCLLVGTGLLVAGDRWSRWLVRRARARDPTPGLELDLTAIAMSGGGSVEHARALVTETLARYGRARGSPPGAAPGAASGAEAIDRVLDLAVRAGAPAAELLRSEADQLRRDARTDGQRRAARLAIALLVPLGVCVLPAFMLLGVVPLLIAVLSTTLSTF